MYRFNEEIILKILKVTEKGIKIIKEERIKKH